MTSSITFLRLRPADAVNVLWAATRRREGSTVVETPQLSAEEREAVHEGGLVAVATQPTAGLAKLLSEEVYQMLVGLKESGITILLVDQEIRHALKIADYVYVLELGRNKYEGSVDDFSSPADIKKAFWA